MLAFWSEWPLVHIMIAIPFDLCIQRPSGSKAADQQQKATYTLNSLAEGAVASDDIWCLLPDVNGCVCCGLLSPLTGWDTSLLKFYAHKGINSGLTVVSCLCARVEELQYYSAGYLTKDTLKYAHEINPLCFALVWKGTAIRCPTCTKELMGKDPSTLGQCQSSELWPQAIIFQSLTCKESISHVQ